MESKNNTQQQNEMKNQNSAQQQIECPLYFLKYESDYYYTVHPGKQNAIHHWNKRNHLFSNTKPNMGSCYYCGSINHYQSYCPLKKCTQCGQYGHDATTHYTHHHHQHRRPCFTSMMKNRKNFDS